MKKLNELKQERADKTAAYQVILDNTELSNEERSAKLDPIDAELDILDKEIERMEKQEARNKKIAVTETPEERTEDTPVDLGTKFRNFLNDAISGKGELTFRAEPILTSTQTGIINKDVNPGLDILTSPGEAFLRELGVSFFPGLAGNFTIPYVGEDTATFPGEDASAANADMAPGALTLAARRVSHVQSITKETLAQTNSGVYTGIVQNLVNGVWNAVTNDVFDTLQTDCGGSRTVTTTVGGLTYSDLVNMEASIGGLNIGAGAYVTTPAVKAYLKRNTESTYGDNIWMDNEVNGYPAYGVPAANANKIYFGDFSKMAVGQWGGIEIIVDPYTKAKQGEIVLTAVALVDTGCYNPNGLVFTSDVSAG